MGSLFWFIAKCNKIYLKNKISTINIIYNVHDYILYTFTCSYSNFYCARNRPQHFLANYSKTNKIWHWKCLWVTTQKYSDLNLHTQLGKSTLLVSELFNIIHINVIYPSSILWSPVCLCGQFTKYWRHWLILDLLESTIASCNPMIVEEKFDEKEIATAKD